MPTLNFLESTRFTGTLIGNGDSVSVAFQVSIDSCGVLNLEFEPLPFTDPGWRIIRWPRPGRNVRYLQLEGTSATGDQIHSNTFYLTSFNRGYGATENTIQYCGECQQAEIERDLASTVQHSQLIWHLRQFEALGPLRRDTNFARVVASGSEARNNPKELTGYIAIEALDKGEDETWWEQSEKLVDHVARVMSLARATYLSPPIERRTQGTTEILKIRNIEIGERPFLTPFHRHNLQQIFDRACDSYTDVSTILKSLDPALQWLFSTGRLR